MENESCKLEQRSFCEAKQSSAFLSTCCLLEVGFAELLNLQSERGGPAARLHTGTKQRTGAGNALNGELGRAANLVLQLAAAARTQHLSAPVGLGGAFTKRPRPALGAAERGGYRRPRGPGPQGEAAPGPALLLPPPLRAPRVFRKAVRDRGAQLMAAAWRWEEEPGRAVLRGGLGARRCGRGR